MVAVLLDGNRPGAVVHAFADGRVVLVPLTAINVPAGRALEVGYCRAASAARCRSG